MATIEINIEDIGYVVTLPVDSETNKPAIQQGALDGYNQLVTTGSPPGTSISQILNKDASSVTDQDALFLLSNLAGLDNLATGKNPDGTAPVVPYILTEEMAKSIDLIAKSFKAVGLNDSHATADFVKKWQNLKFFGLDQIVDAAIAAGASSAVNIDTNPIDPKTLTHTEQAMIELVYVKTANDFIGSALTDLKEAIEINKAALDSLADLQDIHNMITVTTIGQLNALFTSRPEDAEGSPFSNAHRTEFGLLVNFFGLSDVQDFLTLYTDVVKNGANPYIELLKQIDAKPDVDQFSQFQLFSDGTRDNQASTIDIYKSNTDPEYPGLVQTVEKMIQYFHGNNGQPLVLERQDLRNLDYLGRRLYDQSINLPAPEVDLGNSDGKDFIGDDNSNPNGPITFENYKDIINNPNSGYDGALFVGFANAIDPFVDEPTEDIVAKFIRIRSDLQADADAIGPGTLQDAINTLIKDLTPPDGQLIDATFVRNWIVDNLNQYNNQASTTRGDYQTHITNAITAAQTLSDSQTQDVKRIEYIFEAYYKSASSLLSRINKIITSMADAISQ